MPAGMIDSSVELLVPSTTITATGASPVFALPQAECYALYFIVSANAGTGTFAPILQTSIDGGTTWVNTGIAFATSAANNTQGVVFKPTLAIGQAGSVIAPTSGTASAVNQPVVRKFCRLNGTVTGTSVTYTLVSITNPKGYSTT